jgi:hypothetical protein
MRTIRGFALAAIAAAIVFGGAKPSAAMVIYPWCAEYGGRSFGAENCGFVTFQQCLATIAGNGGFCKPNPWYTPYSPPPRGPKPIWR